MFEEEILCGGSERSIRVDTHRGNAIQNVIEPEPGERERRRYDLVRSKFGKGAWRNRKPACGVYNCYGMVFASRRTAIMEDSQIPDILADDGYRETDADSAKPGDIVLYRNAENGSLLHAAVLIRRDPELRTALFALSKWDSACGEDEHHVQHHCWDDQGFYVKVEFWTERPG